MLRGVSETQGVGELLEPLKTYSVSCSFTEPAWLHSKQACFLMRVKEVFTMALRYLVPVFIRALCP